MTQNKVEYTNSLPIKHPSSLVEGIFYNINDDTAFFDLNNRIYKYSNVNINDLQKVADGESPGREYQTFKRKFGPSEYLGEYDNIYWSPVPLKVEVSSNRQGQVGTPTEIRQTFDMPELDVSAFSDAITGITEATGTINNNYVQARNPEYSKFRVGFVVIEENEYQGSVSEIKYHNITALSLDNAKSEVETLGEVLGLKFKVKEVTVYFD